MILGVFAGATKPNQPVLSNPVIPPSAIVGTFWQLWHTLRTGNANRLDLAGFSKASGGSKVADHKVNLACNQVIQSSRFTPCMEYG